MTFQTPNPFLYQLREGSLTDPYVDKVEILNVVNGRAIMSEIPVKQAGVIIEGYFEVETNYPNLNQFYVDYTYGVIYLNPTKNTIITAKYKGKGVVLLPSERIYNNTPEGIEGFNAFANKIKGDVDEYRLELSNVQNQVSTLVVNGDSSPEAAQARIGVDGKVFPTLKERIDAEILSKKNASPKAVFPTYSDLVNSYPQGGSDIYLVASDGKWYYWKDSSWVSGGTYQATGIPDASITSNKLSNSSVTPEKAGFLAKNKNLFNKDTIQLGGYFNGSGVWIQNALFNSSDYISIESNVSYFTNVSTSYSNLIFYNSNKTFLSSITSNTWRGTFTAPLNAAFVRFSFRTTEDIGSLLLTKGVTKTEQYLPYGYNLSKEVVLSQDQMLGFSKTGSSTKNLFDPSKVITGSEITSNSMENSNANSAVSGFIEVSGLHLQISNLTGYVTGNDRLFAFYDENRLRLKEDISSDTIIKTWSDRYIPIPAGAKYFRFNIYSNKTSNETVDFSKIQVELNQYKSPFSPFVESIKQIGGKPIVALSIKPTYGKSLLVFGDSITETATVSDDGVTYTENTRTNWPSFTKVDLEVGAMWNYAKAGAAYRDRTGVLERQKISVQINSAIANNRPGDIIVVACGTNDGVVDLGDYDTAMGKVTLNDLDRTKLYEAIRWAFWKLRTSYPNAVCFAGLPLQRADIEPPEELLTAITKMAKRYNFHLIDGTYQSDIIRDFEVWQATGRDLSDGLHPKTTGAVKMSKLYTRRILEVYK